MRGTLAPVHQWARPGDLVHLDVKKLGRIGRVGHRITGNRRTRVRGIGWEFVHMAIDDASRLAYVEVLGDEGGVTTTKFLWRALAWFRRHGIRVQRLLTDNGNGYVSDRLARLRRSAGLRHRRTRPYTPRTNGKAERFIQTLLREWAYRRPYPTSAQRRDALGTVLAGRGPTPGPKCRRSEACGSESFKTGFAICKHSLLVSHASPIWWAKWPPLPSGGHLFARHPIWRWRTSSTL